MNPSDIMVFKGRRRHTQQPQPHAPQQQIDTDFVEFTPCATSKPCHKELLGCGAATVMRVKRIGQSYVVWCMAVLQPVTAQTSAGADF